MTTRATGTPLPGAWVSLQLVFMTGGFMLAPFIACWRGGGEPRGYPPGRWTALPVVSSWLRSILPARLLDRLEELAARLTRVWWLAPADTARAVVLAFVVVEVLPFAVQALAAALFLGSPNQTHDSASAVSAIIANGAAAPLWEETFFRWTPAYLGGVPGMIVGSLVWAPLHIVQALLIHHDPMLNIARFGPLWMLDVVFFVKVWRGRYYWASYPAHALANIGIVVAGTMGLV